jgi:hypothetical protein
MRQTCMRCVPKVAMEIAAEGFRVARAVKTAGKPPWALAGYHRVIGRTH